jgi:hypothetical protein
MERHISLNQRLVKANEWAIFIALDNLDIPERLKQLEGFFIQHALHYDDSGSNKFAEYIMTTVTDKQLLPFAGVVRYDKEFLEFDQTKWEEIEAAFYTAAINRAHKAAELFLKLSIFKPVPKVVLDDDDRSIRRDYVAEEQTLTKTKEALLLEVANGWKESHDESEADDFFSFIAKVKLHRDDEVARTGALRKITDVDFPVPRLAHTIARFQNEFTGDEKRVLGILAHGWVKHSQQNHMRDLIGLFYAIEPLSEPVAIPNIYGGKPSSAEAFSFVRRVAKRIKAVDDKVQQMLAKVGSYNCVVEYTEQDLIIPAVMLTYCEEIRDENFGRKSFESKRDEINKWLKENRGDLRLRIKLRYLGKNWKKEILVEQAEILY